MSARRLDEIEHDLCWAMQHTEDLTHSQVMRTMQPLIVERRQLFLDEWKSAWAVAATLEPAAVKGGAR